MNYGDESIIEKMNEYKKETHGTIESDMFVKGEQIHFAESRLFEDGMSIMLPDTFEDINDELMKLKYPSEQRPQVIKTSKDNEITFTFSMIDAPLADKDVEATRDSFGVVLKKLNPAISIGDKFLHDIDEKKLGGFEYTSPSLDGTLYNIMYCIPMKQKMMHGTFNCTLENRDAWKPLALAVILTIREITRNM